MSETHHQHNGEHPAMHAAPGGLAVSAAGYTLKAAPTTFVAGREEAFGIRILDHSGRAVREFDEQHGVGMHLIVVRRDLNYYQHLHPSLGTDGTWSVPLTLPEPGVYRAFTDFATGGEPLTLGVDLTAPGYYEPRPLPAPAAIVRAEGYEISLHSGDATAGVETMLVFHVTREGWEVTDLQPYLGALGHLVALREGDLAYLHVHPTPTDSGVGPNITFRAVFPSLGRYRIFLQFAHEGGIHTAAFTAEVLT